MKDIERTTAYTLETFSQVDVIDRPSDDQARPVSRARMYVHTSHINVHLTRAHLRMTCEYSVSATVGVASDAQIPSTLFHPLATHTARPHHTHTAWPRHQRYVRALTAHCGRLCVVVQSPRPFMLLHASAALALALLETRRLARHLSRPPARAAITSSYVHVHTQWGAVQPSGSSCAKPQRASSPSTKQTPLSSCSTSSSTTAVSSTPSSER